MVEVTCNRRTENIESQENVNEVWGVKSCQSMRSYLEKRISQFRSKKDIEMEVILSGVLDAYNHFHPLNEEKNFKLELEIVSGWKGIGNIEVYKGFDNDFRVKEYIKDKETGKVTESIKEVKKEDLNKLIRVIKNLELNKEYSCYQIADMLGWDWKNLWRERKMYFKEYYYPVKILEALKVINYGGRGNITRII